MKHKRVMSGQEAREKALEGMRKVYQPVADTIGPKGRNVGWTNGWTAPINTNDGNTIASRLQLEDPVENYGSELIRQAAEKTNMIAGDGTTTATVLTYAIASEGMREIRNGVNAVEIKNGIKEACAAAVKFLKCLARPVRDEDVSAVAALSSQDVEAGKVISEAFAKVGREGAVVVEEQDVASPDAAGLSLETTQGARWGAGAASPLFFSKSGDNRSVTMDDVAVFVTDKDVSTRAAIAQLFQVFETVGHDKFLLIGRSWTDEALKALAVNWLNGSAKVVAVGAPGIGDRQTEELMDICAMTGATLASSDRGVSDFSKVTAKHLGRAKSFTAKDVHTTLVADPSASALVSSRVEVLRKQAETETDTYKKDRIVERIGKLVGGVAVIKVSAASATEAHERKLRVDDAVNATRSAIEEGILPGGGAALARASKELSQDEAFPKSKDKQIGWEIFARAMEWPAKKIAQNAGMSGDVYVDRIQSAEVDWSAFDVNSNLPYHDAQQAGIIDPLKVERLALEHAASVAGMFLMTEHIVYDAPEEVQPKPISQ